MRFYSSLQHPRPCPSCLIHVRDLAISSTRSRLDDLAWGWDIWCQRGYGRPLAGISRSSSLNLRHCACSAFRLVKYYPTAIPRGASRAPYNAWNEGWFQCSEACVIINCPHRVERCGAGCRIIQQIMVKPRHVPCGITCPAIKCLE